MAEFFEKMKQEMDKGITAISAKSKEVLESTRLKSQIRTLREQRNAASEELGNIVYTMFVKAAGFDELRINSKCQVLERIGSQIKELEEELRKIHLKTQEIFGMSSAVTTCACGTEIYEGTKFCRGCGRQVDELLRNLLSKKVPSETPMEAGRESVSETSSDQRRRAELSASEGVSCPVCSSSMRPTDKFCRSCGNPKN